MGHELGLVMLQVAAIAVNPTVCLPPAPNIAWTPCPEWRHTYPDSHMHAGAAGWTGRPWPCPLLRPLDPRVTVEHWEIGPRLRRAP